MIHKEFYSNENGFTPFPKSARYEPGKQFPQSVLKAPHRQKEFTIKNQSMRVVSKLSFEFLNELILMFTTCSEVDCSEVGKSLKNLH